MQYVYFINPFPCEAAFTVEILIHVRDGACIDVKPRLPRIDGCQSRARGALDAYSDARLQDSVAGHDDVSVRIDDCLVQRMRQGACHAMRRSSRQFRIRVECDHKTNARKNRKVSHLDRETVAFL